MNTWYDPNARRADSTGGPPKETQRFNGPNIEVTRDPLLNNSRIFKDHGPWFHEAYRTPDHVEPGNWNNSGPVAPSLHLRTFNYRKEAGAFHSDTTGMHTMLPVTQQKTQRQPQTMQAGRQNLLSVAIYRGQSYSDNTRIQK